MLFAARHARRIRRYVQLERGGMKRSGGVQRVWDENLEACGIRNVWRQLKREGFRAGRCAVAFLIAAMGVRPDCGGRLKS